ncbi:MAG: hypothetical protein PHP22_06450 [Oscillospiraceae bacterium]|nr:hypothetical protein [Oscillospiraceae bacterium]
MISIEACIVLPIFIILLMFIYGFFILFAGQNIIAHALIQSAQSLSLDSYSHEKLDAGATDSGPALIGGIFNTFFVTDEYYTSNSKWYSEDIASMNDVIKKRFIGYLVVNPTDGKADVLLDYLGVEDGLDGFDFSLSEIDGDYLTVTVTYKQKFIFDFGDRVTMDMQQSIKVKMWGI